CDRNLQSQQAEASMALRPLRNAMISFGLVSIPVRFYTATKSEDIHFNLLHSSCGTRVNRKWWCPYHEKIVDSDELIRGYAVTKNKYVTFSNEEIEVLETDDNRALDITEFVDMAEMLSNEVAEETFNPMAFKDEYRERLLERIKEKARGKTIVSEEKEEEEKGGEVVDIMEALRRSLEKGRAPAAPARARRAPKRA